MSHSQSHKVQAFCRKKTALRYASRSPWFTCGNVGGHRASHLLYDSECTFRSSRPSRIIERYGRCCQQQRRSIGTGTGLDPWRSRACGRGNRPVANSRCRALLTWTKQESSVTVTPTTELWLKHQLEAPNAKKQGPRPAPPTVNT
jgi:hypothetical protein